MFESGRFQGLQSCWWCNACYRTSEAHDVAGQADCLREWLCLTLRDIEVSNIAQVERSASASALSKELQLHFSAIVGRNSVKTYSLQDLASVELPAKTITISLLELEKPFLATMSPEEMDLLRRVTDKTTNLLWLTGATCMSGSSPDLTLASGLSRALMLEQPSLRFVILDVGSPAQMLQPERKRVCEDVERSLFADDVPNDKEFVSRNGLLHVSRFVPDDGLNSRFSERRNQQPTEMTLEAASPARLAIKTVGNMDTIYFQEESDVETEIPKGEIDVDVKAVSLNAKVYHETRIAWSKILKGAAGYLRSFRQGRDKERHIRHRVQRCRQSCRQRCPRFTTR